MTNGNADLKMIGIDHYFDYILSRIHKDGKLISYESKTLQNDREKFVNLIYDSIN